MKSITKVFAPRMAFGLAGLALLAVVFAGVGLRAEQPRSEPEYRVVFQVTSERSEAWEGAFRNIDNLIDALGADAVHVEVVVNSGGIGMARKSNAAMAGRIERLAEGGNVTFLACENTMKRRKIGMEDLLPSFGTVDSGVAQVVRRQAEGWQFVKGD